ncbi:DWNN domain-containing protein [Gamsiella multidivaricata]|uniref:DWNN domain-containing protein n=1 Tax=Gamsiella multidivaricata TaxID=101098 RepID=UPI00221FD9C7|nr:DWNN domain-containing protein [Gamsiella multidivaricata]KAI7819377.1 DWNN domain-containing protein [Gamsiella multidivaricata]
MSQVHYKFKSSKDYDSATFDGHSISVFDLKKEILIAKGLKGPDDLQLTHAESGEEYYDDATLIPRNTSILVARVPAKPGRGGPSAGPYQRQPMEQQQRPPPNTYVCYRCGKKGEHWIQFCPTNNDKSFEPIGIKKTTGIPRSFLKTVESDSLQSKKGVMVTQDGNLVVATTNDYEWKKFHEKSKAALTSEEAYATAPVPDDMKCSICSMLLKSAVRAPCCGTNFCDECKLHRGM